MRNTFSILILTFLMFGCKKVDELTKFDMDFDETIVIESSSGLSLPFNVFTPDMETNSNSTFESNDTRKDLIEEIMLTELDLTINSPTNSNFSFLESIEIFLSAPNMSEIKIAWKDEVSSDIGSKLVLETITTDLKEYIKQDEFSLRVNTITDEVITSDHEINIHSSFFVDAKILGQ